jgi:hypothetical protein
MFTRLDQRVIDLLCCPFCKSKVIREQEYFVCVCCAIQYPLKAVNVGEHVEHVYDFRIQRPSSCVPEASALWAEGQNAYESFHERKSSQDELGTYLDEIDSVTEIYNQEIRMQGSVLDVGGHQGRVRHFLSDREVPIYVSIDPFLDVFKNIQSQPNLFKAYPCLSQPCEFVVARAEELPFIANSFDWVHMRSVIDHFEDPFFCVKGGIQSSETERKAHDWSRNHGEAIACSYAIINKNQEKNRTRRDNKHNKCDQNKSIGVCRW